MSPAVFTVALLVGAAALALWTDARFPSLAPATITGRLMNAGVAAVALVLFPSPTDPAPSQVYLVVLALIALLGYAFLTGLWLLRALQGALLQG